VDVTLGSLVLHQSSQATRKIIEKNILDTPTRSLDVGSIY
jgi:hypothetical protein